MQTSNKQIQSSQTLSNNTKVTVNVHNETAPLKAVVLGIATDCPEQPYANNPKVAEHIRNGTVPTEADLVAELRTFEQVLLENGVQVYRPENMTNKNQIFTRDIGFVIGDQFIQANMAKVNRQVEIEGVCYLKERIDAEKWLIPPEGATIEGGDVIVHNEFIFVGQGDRTNRAGYEFLRDKISNKTVIPVSLRVTDKPRTNILHLDCAFQPVGDGYVVIYEEGFLNPPEALYDIFPENKRISVTAKEMYDMYPNVFSIAPNKVVLLKEFTRLKKELHKRSIETIEVEYEKIARLGGLLRCSTLPLERGN
ncbi:MAG: dimethylarginine dimethylaminohydrolase family protein [Chitinophagales bacterium]